ncbi:hypothetical protein TNCT_97241, partial [Trichonephila clavata]
VCFSDGSTLEIPAEEDTFILFCPRKNFLRDFKVEKDDLGIVSIEGHLENLLFQVM